MHWKSFSATHWLIASLRDVHQLPSLRAVFEVTYPVASKTEFCAGVENCG